MTEVIEFAGLTRLDIPAERILTKALEADLSHALVLGWDDDGDFYFAGSYGGGPETLWLLELAKKRLMEIGDP